MAERRCGTTKGKGDREMTVAQQLVSVDVLQAQLARFTTRLRFDDIADVDRRAMRQRVVDTFGSLLGGFSLPVSRISRRVAETMPSPDGASIIGSRERTTPDMAAFVNATTARALETNDCYVSEIDGGGHPSDVILPVFAAAESEHLNGKELIVALTLAYEVYIEMCDAAPLHGFDHPILGGLAAAVGSAKAMGLTEQQIREAISLVVVPNNALMQTRRNRFTMWKGAAAGQAGRAGVFAAMLARAGMEGPELPFSGTDGWFTHVTGGPVSLNLEEPDRPFRVRDTLLKAKAACAAVIPSILAAETAAQQIPVGSEIDQVVVETYATAYERTSSNELLNPQSRESADHSIPYVVAATLLRGEFGPDAFEDEQLQDSDLRELIGRVAVRSDQDLTARYNGRPRSYPCRVTVETKDGGVYQGDADNVSGPLINPVADGEVERKFLNLTEPVLGPDRARSALDRLWRLEELDDIGSLRESFVVG
jgi:2-methylcitrate dehydratase